MKGVEDEKGGELKCCYYSKLQDCVHINCAGSNNKPPSKGVSFGNLAD